MGYGLCWNGPRVYPPGKTLHALSYSFFDVRVRFQYSSRTDTVIVLPKPDYSNNAICQFSIIFSAEDPHIVEFLATAVKGTGQLSEMIEME